MTNAKTLIPINHHPFIGQYCRPSNNGQLAEIISVSGVIQTVHSPGSVFLVPTTVKIRFPRSGRTQNVSFKRVQVVSSLEVLGSSADETEKAQ